MNFCKMCGTGLQDSGAASQPTSTPATSTATRVCQACHKETPSELAFCQQCGGKQAAPQQAVAATEAVSSGGNPISAKEVTPVPGALSRPVAHPPTGQRKNATIAGVIAKDSGKVMALAHEPDEPEAASARASEAAPASEAEPQAPRPEPQAPSPEPEPSFGRLVSMLPDGSEGKACELVGTQVDVGRHEGALTFPDDAYLARRHGRIEKRGDQVFVKSLNDANGVYLRVAGPVALCDGDRFLVGKEVFRFEEVAPEEQIGSPALQHGVLLFGSPERPVLGRLVQVTVAGTARDTIYLGKPVVVVGREEGDLRYPDDDFLSRRHAEIATRDGKAWLRDLASSNGTFFRVRHECAISSGDFVRMGNQLFRFDAASE